MRLLLRYLGLLDEASRAALGETILRLFIEHDVRGPSHGGGQRPRRGERAGPLPELPGQRQALSAVLQRAGQADARAGVRRAAARKAGRIPGQRDRRKRHPGAGLLYAGPCGADPAASLSARPLPAPRADRSDARRAGRRPRSGRDPAPAGHRAPLPYRLGAGKSAPAGRAHRAGQGLEPGSIGRPHHPDRRLRRQRPARPAVWRAGILRDPGRRHEAGAAQPGRQGNQGAARAAPGRSAGSGQGSQAAAVQLQEGAETGHHHADGAPVRSHVRRPRLAGAGMARIPAAASDRRPPGAVAGMDQRRRGGANPAAPERRWQPARRERR